MVNKTQIMLTLKKALIEDFVRFSNSLKVFKNCCLLKSI